MKKIALLSTLALSLAACGTLPQATAPTAPVSALVLTTEAAQLQAAGVQVTLTGDTLTLSPTGTEATVRGYLDESEAFVPSEVGARITGPYALPARVGLTLHALTPSGWVQVARLR